MLETATKTFGISKERARDFKWPEQSRGGRIDRDETKGISAMGKPHSFLKEDALKARKENGPPTSTMPIGKGEGNEGRKGGGKRKYGDMQGGGSFLVFPADPNWNEEWRDGKPYKRAICKHFFAGVHLGGRGCKKGDENAYAHVELDSKGKEDMREILEADSEFKEGRKRWERD